MERLFNGSIGGRGVTYGYSVVGSIPMDGKRSDKKSIPVFALKHSRIIQRRGMRARE